MMRLRELARCPFAVGYAVVALILAVAMALCFKAAPYGFTVPDTGSYTEAFRSICHGQVHLWRMPVYPMIIGTCFRIFGPDFGGTVTALLQWGMFVVTLICLRRLLLMLTGSARLTFWIFAFYALAPGNFECNQVLFSEATATCLTMLAAYRAVCSLRRPSVSNVLLTLLWLGLLLSLKPAAASFLAAAVVWLVLLLWLHRGRVRRQAIVILAALCVFIAGLALYSVLMYRYNGVRTLSIAGTANNYFTLREAGLVTPENCSDHALRQVIADSIGTEIPREHSQIWDEYWCLYRASGPAVLEKFTNEVMMANKGVIVRHIINRFNSECARYMIISTKAAFVPWSFSFLPKPSVNMAVWILGACLAVFGFHLRRYPLWASEGLCICLPAFVYIATAAIFAMDDYTRLVHPVQPLFWIGIAMLAKAMRVAPLCETPAQQ
ncbi:MAG: hypothetical protein K2I56_04850 [Muribaculaceae bacterium]|nr:hypothetical protein [Muribaculaceae bacterium]